MSRADSGPKLRKEIEAFARHMEQKLRSNDWKGGWEKMTILELRHGLEQEVLELSVEIESATQEPRTAHFIRVMEEAVDVANRALMIFDQAKREADERLGDS